MCFSHYATVWTNASNDVPTPAVTEEFLSMKIKLTMQILSGYKSGIWEGICKTREKKNKKREPAVDLQQTKSNDYQHINC